MAVLTSAGDILVVNAGSTSLKVHRVDPSGRSVATELDGAEAAGLDGVAHRVVHGGTRFSEPVVIDDGVRDEIRMLESIAPLHNVPALRAIDRARALMPFVPHVAVFDTAFHATIPNVASTYAVPLRWREASVRRFGFHGLSLTWARQRSAELLDRPASSLRLVVCHLGGGCSVTAIAGGDSMDTTMGFSPLEGVPMATRSGSVDPGALIHLMQRHGETPESLAHILNEESGLAGLAGTGNVGDLERRAGMGDSDAQAALDIFSYRVAGAAAAMTMAAGGLDALVFTAGIGERSAMVREAVCSRLGFLDVSIDREANVAGGDRDIARPRRGVRVLVIHAREDLVAARAARVVLHNSAENY